MIKKASFVHCKNRALSSKLELNGRRSTDDEGGKINEACFNCSNSRRRGCRKYAVLAEKPSVGRDLARVLKCHKKGNGFLEGDQYIVTWALGHLVTLADPEGYGKEFQSWRLEDLPIIPEPLKLVVMKKTGKQFQAVKAQLARKDVKDIVIATDAGREEGSLSQDGFLKKRM
ncbi:DNA topoisomerase 3 [Bacillus safensis subsp. safensis]